MVDPLHGLRRVVGKVAPHVGLLAHIGEKDTLLSVTRLLHVRVLVCYVYAISSHHHLTVEWTVYLVHLHLTSSTACQDAAGQAPCTEARRHI